MRIFLIYQPIRNKNRQRRQGFFVQSGRNGETMLRTFHRCGSIWHSFFMKRWKYSDDKRSHGLWHNLKSLQNILLEIIYTYNFNIRLLKSFPEVRYSKESSTSGNVKRDYRFSLKCKTGLQIFLEMKNGLQTTNFPRNEKGTKD